MSTFGDKTRGEQNFNVTQVRWWVGCQANILPCYMALGTLSGNESDDSAIYI